MDKWKLVPVEPTEEMWEAAKKADCFHASMESYKELYGAYVRRRHALMLSAAPQPAALGEQWEVLAYLVQDARDGQYSAHRLDPRGWAHGYPVFELVDRAHVARLQAEVERLIALHDVDTEAMRRMLARNAALEDLLHTFAENSDDSDVVDLSLHALAEGAKS